MASSELKTEQGRMSSIIAVPLMAFVCIMVFASAVFAAQSAVNLGTAGNFAVLAKSGISTTGTTSIVGDIGVSPIDSTAITGFGLILDPSTQFATSSIVTGKVYAADYSPPTPTVMTTAIGDMETAYTDAAGRTLPDATELGAGNIDGMTIAPGLYKWGTGVTIPTGVTLSGGPNDVWIFQIAQNLDVGNGAIITLSGGAQPQNVFWQVAGQTTLGTTSDFKGIILSQTAIVLNTGAKLNGRALAQTAVTLDADALTAPTGATPTPTPTPAPTPAPTPTPTPNPTPTPTPTPAPNPTPTPVPTPPPTVTPTPTPQPTPQPTPTPTVTPTPSPQPTTQPPAPSPTATGASPTPTPKPTAAPTSSATPASTQTPSASTAGSAIPGANLPTLVVAVIIVILAAGLYYYLNVRKK